MFRKLAQNIKTKHGFNVNVKPHKLGELKLFVSDKKDYPKAVNFKNKYPNVKYQYEDNHEFSAIDTYQPAPPVGLQKYSAGCFVGIDSGNLIDSRHFDVC